MMIKALRRGALAMVMLVAGATASEAAPMAVAPAETINPPSVELAQYNPGHYSRLQYRRAMRRYRGHPGARYELRQNRRIYCRNTPERC